MGYDIIGDIHGHADALAALLKKMGYQKRGSAWRHPGRQAIFIGDLIDRGPGQVETVRIARGMVEAGAALAVMGNHEFNAIAWHTQDPRNPGHFLRPHSEKNLKQHQAFLAETAEKPRLRQEILGWFMDLPLWLDLPGLRAVHACWHPEYMAQLEPVLQLDQRLDVKVLEAACRRGSPEFRAVEAILKGPEVELPDGITFRQGDQVRGEARTRWWDAGAVTYRQSAIVDEQTRRVLPDTPIPEALRFGYEADKPVLVGHYWMRGTPQLLARRVACVDYSAGHGEPLVAYRWDGETDLVPGHFVAAK